MNFSNLMKDPYYAEIMFGIELLIHKHDQKAKEIFKDSDAKSSIRMALSVLKGKRGLATPPKNEQERRKSELAIAIVDNFKLEEKTLNRPRQDYIKALLAVEDSLKTRREMYGHSRGYLEFLTDFIAQAGQQ